MGEGLVFWSSEWMEGKRMEGSLDFFGIVSEWVWKVVFYLFWVIKF